MYGRGSGFIASTDGYIVTNAHVVNGTGTIKVYLRDEQGNIIMESDGSSPRAHIASIKGISECADLAVIKIDEGIAARPLTFHEGDIEEGLVVVAAGYPSVAGASFNSTTGTISNKPKSTATPWAYPIAFGHEARINAGNSGGPLVAASTGKVIGVNFAGNTQYDTNLAISGLAGRSFHLPTLVENLKQGDIFSIGVSGEVIVSGNIAMGVWVSAVRPGSPAHRAKIAAGDRIISLNNHPLVSGDTANLSLKNYCEILAGNDPSDPSNIVPFTVETQDGRQLQGELNGTPLDRSNTSPPPEPETRYGEVIYGELSSDDHQFDDETYADAYVAEATTNGTAFVEMQSSSIDSYLIVASLNPDGSVNSIVAGDDDSAGDLNARAVFNTVINRRYAVIANSVRPNETDSYRLLFSNNLTNVRLLE